MVSDSIATALVVGQFAAAALTLLIGLRIAYILSANPIGEFAQELLYLRIRDLRLAGLFGAIALFIEVGEALLPLLQARGWLAGVEDLTLLVNAGQSILILIAGALVLAVVRRYTHRALDRRIRESMETLAYLEGQRRRRRSLDRGDYEPSDEE